MKPTVNYGLSNSLIDAVRKAVEEALVGGQKKLDVDKDGKLEKTDFASLRAKKDTVDTKPKLKEEEQIDEAAAHGYKLKLTKTTHPKDVTDDQDEPVKAIEKHYEVHHNDKKVGNILHHYNDYGGHFYDADLHGKKVPYGRSKGGEGAHNFLKSVVNTKFHSNLKKEEVEQMDEAPMKSGAQSRREVDSVMDKYGFGSKQKEAPKSNIRKVVGKSYGADYKDPEGEDETAADMKKPEPKRKSGPQGTMARRFNTKSYEKIKGKLKAQY